MHNALACHWQRLKLTSEILPRFHFGHFITKLADFTLQGIANAKNIRLILNPGYSLLEDPRSPPGFTLFDKPTCFRPHALAADETTAATLPLRPPWIPCRQLSEQRRHAVGNSISYIFVRQRLPLYSTGPPRPVVPNFFSVMGPFNDLVDSCGPPQNQLILLRTSGLY